MGWTPEMLFRIARKVWRDGIGGWTTGTRRAQGCETMSKRIGAAGERMMASRESRLEGMSCNCLAASLWHVIGYVVTALARIAHLGGRRIRVSLLFDNLIVSVYHLYVISQSCPCRTLRSYVLILCMIYTIQELSSFPLRDGDDMAVAVKSQ